MVSKKDTIFVESMEGFNMDDMDMLADDWDSVVNLDDMDMLADDWDSVVNLDDMDIDVSQ